MLFGIGSRTQTTKRGGLLGGGTWRNAALAGAGMLALRWWRNRRNPHPATGAGPRGQGRNPVHGWQ